jgi:hypothetical protein
MIGRHLREMQAMTDRNPTCPVTLPNGAVAHFEVRDLPGADSYEDVAALPLSFDSVVAAIEGVAGALGSTMKKLSPKSASVELGVELSAKEGKLLAVFVQGEGKANLKVTLEWGG